MSAKSKEPKLSLLVPAFNEQERLASTLRAIESFLSNNIESHEIIVIDDGSSDETADVAEQSGVSVVRHSVNRGKGAALRSGVAAARGRMVVFTDADLAYPPSLIGSIVDALDSGADVVVGNRRHSRSSELTAPRLSRRAGGAVINLLVRLLLPTHVRDTQCGIKGFRSAPAKLLFSQSMIDGFAADAEICALARHNGFSIVDVPVSVNNRSGSSVRMVADTIRFARDLVRIRFRLLARAYATPSTRTQKRGTQNSRRRGANAPYVADRSVTDLRDARATGEATDYTSEGHSEKR